MEDKLKNILKKKETFAELTDFERTQLAEWCADEQEFQSLKRLFRHVDVWSDQYTDESNTKMRLDQLFAVQYAGKQSSEGPLSVHSKQGFLSLNIWGTITAVAAALVLTWYFYPSSPQVQLAKNDTKKKDKMETHREYAQTSKMNEEKVITEKISREREVTSNQEAMALVELGKISSDDVAMDTPSALGAEDLSTVSSGFSSTLSATGATSYFWKADSFQDVQVSSKKNGYISKDIGNGRKEKDSFSAFSLKSMPEMLEILVASY